MKRVAAQLPTSDSQTRRARLIGVESERTPERPAQPGQDLEQDSGGANQFVFFNEIRSGVGGSTGL
jgi:hypothetical protein